MKLAIITTLLLSNQALADDRSDRLRANVWALPDVRPELVDEAVDAALAVETKHVTAELLLALAWGESRMEPGLHTGFVCGALQVNPADIDEPHSQCKVWANDQVEGFAAGVKELEMMLLDHRVHGSLERALLYRACGNSAFNGTCSKKKWPRWVIERTRWLHKPVPRPAT